MDESVPVYIWAALPLVVSLGAAILSYILTYSRMQVALARQRQALAEARALLATQHLAMEQRVKAVAEETRRKALEEFLADIHVEERQTASRGIAERVFFRNVPLTPWVERGADLAALPPADLRLTSLRRH